MNVDWVMIAFGLGFDNICYSIIGIFKVEFEDRVKEMWFVCIINEI